jgi:aromatic-L-amino-acid decarboxylase
MNPIEISADEFRRRAVRATKLAREYLENFDGQPIAPSTTGAETLRQFRAPLEAGLGDAALNDLPELMRLSRAQNGRFFGCVLGSGEPAWRCG